MDVTLVLFLAGFVLFFGLFSEWLFTKTSVPDVFWMVLLGVILQYSVGKPAGVDAIAPLFTTFALIFIVFEGASNIPLRQAATHFASSLKLSGLNFSLGFTCAFLLGIASGLGVQLSFILGCIAPTLSGGILGQIQSRLPVQSGTGTLLAFEAAITDVIGVLGVVTMVGFANFAMSTFLAKALNFFILSSTVGIILAIVWALLLRKWITEHNYILTIAFLLMIYSFNEYIGASGSVAAMAFALTLGNIKLLGRIIKDKNIDHAQLNSHQRRFYSELSFLIRSFLFVWMGLIVDFSLSLYLGLGVVLGLLLFIVRSYTVRAIKGMHEKDRLYVSVLGAKDITPLVLASLPVQANIAGAQNIFTLSFGLILTSILLTSLLVFLVRKEIFYGFPQLFTSIKRTLQKQRV